MSRDRTLTFYLEEPMRKRAADGKINFINRVCNAFAGAGFGFDFRENTDLELLRSQDEPGYALFFMDEPFHHRALTARLAYYYPFWRIENTARRWEGSVARASFDAESIDGEEAAKFAAFWRRRLFGDALARDDGFVLVPLQGRLLSRRSFQAASPVEMVRTTAARFPGRKVVVSPHPKEKYSRIERAALSDLKESNGNVELSDEPAESLVKRCHLVVTENSAVALAGFFFRKPAVVFAGIDFHHIAGNVPQQGTDAAFEHALGTDAPFEKYLFWFLQVMSINAGRPEAEDKILARVRALGWDV